MPVDTFCTDLSYTHADIRSVLSLVQFREMIIEFIPLRISPNFSKIIRLARASQDYHVIYSSVRCMALGS